MRYSTVNRHLKQRIRNFVLRVVENLVSAAARPFSEAPDLESYSTNGYYLLFFVLLIASALWWFATLGSPLNQSNFLVQAFYGWLVAKIPVIGTIPPKYLPAATLPLLIWAVLLPIKAARRWLGEKTTNGCFKLLNGGISAGEWCIEHRWSSLLLILFLSAGIAVMITVQIQRMNRSRTLERDLYYWIQRADDFLASTPATKSDINAYKPLTSTWLTDFGSLLARSDGTTHPALCLHEMLDVLYKDTSDQPWTVALQMKHDNLHRAFDRCSATALIASPNRLETRSRAMIRLLLARIDTRLTDDPNMQRYSDDHELVEARDLFQSVIDANYASGDDARRYRADAHNGLGTVYSHALTGYLNSSSPTSRRQNLTLVCGNPAQCAERSLQEYEAAGKDWEPCSYRNKRQRNNTADLLIKIGMHYDNLATSLTAPPFNDWLPTRLSMADQIDQHLRDVMSCNYTESFFSTFALTAAQGLAVSARLRRESATDGTAQLLAAGHYLRLASSFEPRNVPNWDASYYCFAVKSGTMDTSFRQAILSSGDTLPSAERVVQMIEAQCR